MNRSGRLAAQGALVLLVCFVGQACVTKARGWRVETVDHDGNVGHTLSLSLDKTDHPHISYHEYTRCGHPAPPCDANLRYTHFNGASWKIEVVEDLREGLLTGRDSSLVLDKDGYPHISYGGDVLIPVSDGTYSLTNRYALQYIYYDGFTWQPAEVIAYGGTYPSLAVDEANQVHVSYFDTLNGTLNYAHRSGSTWVVAIVDEVEEHYGASASLALDSVGMPHLSYYDSDDEPYAEVLKHTYFDGSTWIVEVVDGLGYPGDCSSLALDERDRPHISYQDWTNNLLKYAWYDGTSWKTEVVDVGGDAIGPSSLALDSADHPHISYLADERLKYAYSDGSSWKIETIVRTGNNGWPGSISLALDQAGRAHIAYYYWPQGNLKHAWRTSAP